MQQKTSKKLLVDYCKFHTLLRLKCPESLIIKALKLDPVEKTGDDLIDSYLESLVDYKEFNNWGGNRNPTGRNQHTKNNKSGQLDHQVGGQDIGQVVDKDTDYDKDYDKDKAYNNSGIRKKSKNDADDPQINPPTLEEVLAEAALQNSMAGMGGYKISQEEAKICFSWYGKVGWVVANSHDTPIRNWKFALRCWALDTERKRLEKLEKDGIPTGPRPFRDDSKEAQGGNNAAKGNPV